MVANPELRQEKVPKPKPKQKEKDETTEKSLEEDKILKNIIQNTFIYQ
jgi:hypothetical protein